MTRLRTVLCLTTIVLFSAGPVLASLNVSHIATDAEMRALLSDTGNPAMTAQYDWPNGTAVPWSLSYDAMTQLVTFTVDNVSLQYTTPPGGFTDVFVRSMAVNAGSAILVDNIALDGETVGDVSNAVGNGLDILRISGGVLADGFTLSGQATMSWTGDRPAQSRLAFQIKVGTLTTVRVAASTWGQLKHMYNK